MGTSPANRPDPAASFRDFSGSGRGKGLVLRWARGVGVLDPVLSASPALSRPNGHLSVALDGDDAGRAAAARAFPLLTAPDIEASVVELAPGADPASLLQRDGRDGLRHTLLRTRPLADIVVDQQIERNADRLEWPEGRLAATRAAIPTIALLPSDQALRQVRRVADRVGLPVPAVTEELAADLARDESPRGFAQPQREHARTPTSTTILPQRCVFHRAHR